jgi:hypothetical protein
METALGAETAEKAADMAGPAPGPRLSVLDSEAALFDLRYALASRSRSYRFGRGNVEEAFRLLLRSALQELPYRRERGIPPDWKADVREDLRY